MNGDVNSTALNNNFAAEDDNANSSAWDDVSPEDLCNDERQNEGALDDDAVIPLVRERYVEEYAASKTKKKKTKAKKENILPVSIEFKKKPEGYSSTTRFVGDDEYDFPDDTASARNEINTATTTGIVETGLGQNHASSKFHVSNGEAVDSDDFSSETSSSSNVKPPVVEQEVETNEQETETEVFEPDHFQDELVKLRLQLKTYQKENSSLREQIEILNDELKIAQSNTKNDTKKLIKENTKLKEKMNQLQKDLTSKEEDIEQISCQKTAFFERVQTLEKERRKLQQTIAQNENLVDGNEQKHRAICAEITVLEIQKNYEVEIKEKAVKDAKKVVSHLDLIISKCMPDDAVAARKYQDEFQEVVDTLERHVEKMKKEYDAQIEQVRNGKQLSSLKRVEIPKAPVPPPTLELKGFSPVNAGNTSGSTSVINSTNSTYNAAQRPIFSARAASDIFRPPAPVPQQQQMFQQGPPIRSPLMYQPPQPSMPPHMMGPQGGPGFAPGFQRPAVAGQGAIPKPYIPPLFPSGKPSPPGFSSQAVSHPLPEMLRPTPVMAARPVAGMPPDFRPPPGLNPNFAVHVPQDMAGGTSAAAPVSTAFSQMKTNLSDSTMPSVSGAAAVSAAAPTIQPTDNFFEQGANFRATSTLSKVPLTTEGQPQPTTNGGSSGGFGTVPPAKLSATAVPFSAPSPILAAASNTAGTGAAAGTTGAAAGGKQSQKIDKIYEYFIERFPNITKDDIKTAIQQFRDKQPSKKLSGLTMQQLKNGVEPLVIRQFGPPTGSLSGSSTRASSVIGDIMPSPPRRPEDEECFICTYPKSMAELQMLDCRHEAHKVCLNKWLLENKTCPICRNLALSEDDFPRL